MTQEDFSRPAELYSGRNNRMRRASGLRYRRFDTLAEAVKYVVEEQSAQLDFATIDSGEASFRAAEIRKLYASSEFPLPRA